LATEARAASLALQGLIGKPGVLRKPELDDLPEEVDAGDLLGTLSPAVKWTLLSVALGPPLLICAKNPDAFFPMLEVRLTLFEFDSSI
jgi:hypothetical protein